MVDSRPDTENTSCESDMKNEDDLSLFRANLRRFLAQRNTPYKVDESECLSSDVDEADKIDESTNANDDKLEDFDILELEEYSDNKDLDADYEATMNETALSEELFKETEGQSPLKKTADSGQMYDSKSKNDSQYSNFQRSLKGHEEAIRNLEVPDPEKENLSEEEFEIEVQKAYKKFLPENLLQKLRAKKCKMCNERFSTTKDSFRHYIGSNHKRAVKCYIKGTFKGHPPFFKMCLEAIASEKFGASKDEIFDFINSKYRLSYARHRIDQLINWGIERLYENEYVKKSKFGKYELLDPSLPEEIRKGLTIRLPSLEYASTRKSRDFSIVKFEHKIYDRFKDDLPFHLLKTLKPNYCGLCRKAINERDPWKHYDDVSHRRASENWSHQEHRRTSANKERNWDTRRGRDSGRDRYSNRRKRSLSRSQERGHGERYESKYPRRSFKDNFTSLPKERPKRQSSSSIGPFMNKDVRNLPTTKLPVVFINSSGKNAGPKSIVIPKAKREDFD